MNMVERYRQSVERAGRPDNQMDAYYKWEDYRLPLKRLLDEELSWNGCKELVARVWSRYSRTKPPYLKAIRGDSVGSSADRNHLRIATYTRNKAVILHEISHSIMYLKWPKSYRTDAGKMEGHGPEFARLHAEVVSIECGIPLNEILTSMRRAGLRVAWRSEVPKMRKRAI